MRFPVIASLAPLAAAGVIWAITGSAFTLVFAILGPVIAVATMIDGRRTSRARLRADTAAYAEAVDAVRCAVARRHEAMRRAAWARTPAACTILDSPEEGGRWQRPTATAVTLGSGTVLGELRLDGPGNTAENRELRAWAAALTEAPLAVDPRGGIGIAGPLTLSRALARGLLVQLCFAIPPGRCAPPQVPAAGWEWAQALPHADAGSPSPAIVISEGSAFDPAAPDSAASPDPDRILIAVAGTVGELPPGCETIVRVQGPARAEIVRSTAHAWATEFRPELVSTEDAARFAGRLRSAALAVGLVAQRRLPHSVALAELRGNRAQRPAGPTMNLEASLGVGEQGDFSLDLVAAGPHAVVGGTTGSGKSELLVTWVASLASSYSPAQLTFLLVDFKGGSAFGPLAALPHCVGLITDLDQGEAARALRSLAAELRYREERLRDAGARDIGRLGPAAALPRLVIVVDEFATMLDAFPELHARFVDIAARGRSLGVHLILCTQRPAGVVRDALLANCSLRLSLRVNNRADSIAVIGTDAAARLAPDQPGRCLVETAGGGIRPCQVATTAEGDIRAIADAAPAGPGPRRPWLPRLPAILTIGELRAATANDAVDPPGGGYLLGLVDEPDRQRHRVADYRPARDGNLLVLGGAGSGKSSLLASLAAQEPDGSAKVELIAPDVESAWDALQSASGELPATVGGNARLLLFDDLDSVWARWEPEYRIAAAELLAGLLRDGRAGGLHLVITVQRIAGALQALPGLCQSTLWLRLSSRSEHAAAGGDNALFDPALPPGGGTWQGSRIQLPLPEPGRRRESPTAVTASVLASVQELPAASTTLIVVSAAPARSAQALRSALQGRRAVVDIAASARDANGRPELAGDAGGTVFVGDADSWQAQWGLFSALRPGAGIVFDGCSLAEYRMISRRREMPPPLAPGRGHVWMLRPDGTVIRASFPSASSRA